MGDSVTHTGDFETMLTRLLERATDNPNINFVDKSYGGRSVDAAVRHFTRDTSGIKPHLGLLMYGLNDQAGFVPLRAYLEQYEWIAKALDDRFQADTIFLQPTPHICIFDHGPDRKPYSPQTAFRTIGFAEAVKKLGDRLNVPTADTFDAIWGKGGDTVAHSVIAMWPVYPRSAGDQFSTMLESGKGDTIHPNALGHLRIAKAVFDAISGKRNEKPLRITGLSRWTEHAVVTRITATNSSTEERTGQLEAYPFSSAEIEAPNPVRYELKPEESVSFEVAWPKVRRPEDLLLFPYCLYMSQNLNQLPVLDFTNETCTVYCARLPFEVPGDFVSERLAITGNSVNVKLKTSDGEKIVNVRIPEDSQVGRISLIRKLHEEEKEGYAVAEVVYVQYGQALPGEAKVDGELDEWADHRWIPIGESCQARGRLGPEDHRESLQEAYIQAAFNKGENGFFIAFRGRGDLVGDNATLFFDPRPPAELGTVGTYYWLGFKLEPNGVVKLGKGETSTSAPGMTGRWQTTKEGLDAEIFVPYALMDVNVWPVSGDLGFSIVWNHKHKDGRITRMTWSEDGHEWNPRWYGVLRLSPETNGPGDNLPYMVRIK
jgi:lysophospholipase L1-like esterase